MNSRAGLSGVTLSNMALVIDDPVTVKEIERQASAAGKTPAEIVASAFDPRKASGVLPGDPTVEELMEELRTYGVVDKNDLRSNDEIVGYNSRGHFDGD